MSNALVNLECVSTGAVYFKLKVGRSYLKFQNGRVTLTDEQWKKLQEQMKEMGCLNLIGREFGLVGTLKNPATIQPIKAIRGFDRGSMEMSASSKPELSLEERIAAVDAERIGSAAPSADHIDPNEASRLVAEHEESERLLKEQARIDAEEKRKKRQGRKKPATDG